MSKESDHEEDLDVLCNSDSEDGSDDEEDIGSDAENEHIYFGFETTQGQIRASGDSYKDLEDDQSDAGDAEEVDLDDGKPETAGRDPSSSSVPPTEGEKNTKKRESRPTT